MVRDEGKRSDRDFARGIKAYCYELTQTVAESTQTAVHAVKWSKPPHGVLTFETELRCFIQAAANLDVGKLILETDALMVQQAMRSDNFDASMPEGALVEELKFLARVNFIDFECIFLSRVGNRAAGRGN